MASNTKEQKDKCACEGFWWKLNNGLLYFSSILGYFGVIKFVWIMSRRSKKHTFVGASPIIIRLYGGGVSTAQVLSKSLWAYGIHTFLIYCIFEHQKPVDNNGECIPYIETKFYVPSSRAWEADMSIRQWVNHEFHHLEIVTPEKYHPKYGYPSSKYADSQPRIPKGIPFKPISLIDRILITLFSNQFNGNPDSHIEAKKKNGKTTLKRKPKQTNSKKKTVQKKTQQKRKPSTKRKPSSKKTTITLRNPLNSPKKSRRKEAKTW